MKITFFISSNFALSYIKYVDKFFIAISLTFCFSSLIKAEERDISSEKDLVAKNNFNKEQSNSTAIIYVTDAAIVYGAQNISIINEKNNSNEKNKHRERKNNRLIKELVTITTKQKEVKNKIIINDSNSSSSNLQITNTSLKLAINDNNHHYLFNGEVNKWFYFIKLYQSKINVLYSYYNLKKAEIKLFVRPPPYQKRSILAKNIIT